MVRMQTVTVELDGGIRNPACQNDLGESCYSEKPNCRPLGVPNTKSTELLTVQSTERLELGAVVGHIVDPNPTSAGSQGAREKIMNACRSFWHWRLLVNALIVVSMIVFLSVIELGILPHQRIGFYCNDPKISLPFTGETITPGILIGGTVAIPLIVMWLAEWTCHKYDSYRNSRPGCAGTRGRQIWAWYGHYTIGVIFVLCICDFAKVIIGAPRPHFLDTCQPRELQNCTDSYVSSYTCTNTNQASWFVMDASKSFPSGHSALSMFTSVYLFWYIRNRLPRRVTTTLFKSWMQYIVLCWGILCSLTRITDNRHHWWDVLAGITLGVAAAIYSVRVNCKGFIIRDNGVGGWTHSEPVENGHHGYDSRRHQSVKKLLSSTSVENREMGDVATTWKE